MEQKYWKNASKESFDKELDLEEDYEKLLFEQQHEDTFDAMCASMLLFMQMIGLTHT